MTGALPDVTVFTVEKANSALPLVRRIVADITAEHPVWRDLVGRYELVVAGARADQGESREMLALRQQVDRVAARISGYVTELEQIGVTLKDFETGLVDFYGVYEGRLVCLCWREGESAVTSWHEMDTGFAGRKPITPEFIAAQETMPARQG
ncbi:MAG TPA: DUF2203 domain-containing protein [Gemmatimonadales bacterium]|jgi:hypothetical protein